MTKMDALMTAMNMMMQANDNGQHTDAIEVLGKMVDQLANANSKPHKPTARQMDNDRIKAYLADAMTSEPMSCADIVTMVSGAVEVADPITSARIASILTNMVKAGQMVKSDGKGGKTLYSAPVAE